MRLAKSPHFRLTKEPTFLWVYGRYKSSRDDNELRLLSLPSQVGLLRWLTTRQCSLFLNAVYYFKFLTNQNKRVVTQLFYKSDNILKDLSLKVKIPDLRSEISLLLADQGCIYDHKQTKRFSWKDNEKKKMQATGMQNSTMQSLLVLYDKFTPTMSNLPKQEHHQPCCHFFDKN